MKLLRTATFAICFLIGVNVLAANIVVKKRRAPIDSSKVIQVKYSLPAWNKNSEKIDSGDIILRESTTKKLLKFEIEETEPDSGTFSGYYSVNWGAGEPVVPEVFILPQQQEITDKDLTKIKEQIDSGQIKRKPIVVRKGEDGVQILEVFDTKEQAEEALKILQASDKNKFRSKSAPELAYGKVAMAVHDSTELKKFAEEEKKRSEDEEKLQFERLRQEQTEKQRVENLKRQQSLLSEHDKEVKKKQAAEFAEAALDFYRVHKYSDAEKLFRKSFELDPSQAQYYFQYGIALYRNQKYNEAVVALQVAKGPGVIEAEREYYLGLATYQLKEYDESFKTFQSLEKRNDKKLSPIGSFYLGLIKFYQRQYEDAKPYFQDVLDTSEDPDLDKRADRKLDEIDRILEFAKNKSKKFIFSATLGAQYDSNVTLLSNTVLDQGTATNVASPRAVTGLGLMWRPVFDKDKEFGIKTRTDYIYTLNNSLTSTDPLVVDITAPYTLKGTKWGKSAKLDIKPGFESLFIGQAGTGVPAQKLNGAMLDTSASFVMRPNWYFTGTLQTRYDTFFDISDESAFRWTLKADNIFFLDQDNKKGIITDLGYGLNMAKGTAYQTARIDASALYMTPTKFIDMTFTGGMYFYNLTYTSTAVYNNNFNFIASLNRSLNEWLDVGFVTTYMINRSNDASSTYNKYTVGLIFNMETSL